jgi:hypothetical protein
LFSGRFLFVYKYCTHIAFFCQKIFAEKICIFLSSARPYSRNKAAFWIPLIPVISGTVLFVERENPLTSGGLPVMVWTGGRMDNLIFLVSLVALGSVLARIGLYAYRGW